MAAKRIVLIGGPSTGKTTLINALEAAGHIVFEEVSRQVTKAAQEKGIDQLFLTEPLRFSEALLKERIAQWERAGAVDAPFVFMDRGIPDVVAYLEYVNAPYPARFTDACRDHTYDTVFALPAWEAIHETDGERYEDYGTAKALEQVLFATYKSYGHKLIPVPKVSVAERVAFLLKNVVP